MGTLKKASNPMSHKQLPSKNKGSFNKKHVNLKSVPRQVKNHQLVAITEQTKQNIGN